MKRGVELVLVTFVLIGGSLATSLPRVAVHQGQLQGRVETAKSLPRVEVHQGQLQGRVESAASGRSYLAFRGVPYAAPPVGSRRFQVAAPPEPWSGVRDAGVLSPSCLQYANTPSPDKVVGDEDCLTVNVYTPRLPAAGQRLLDVIVFIHGGAFMYGGSYMPQPAYIMDHDVVLVSLNYRLGILGFLSAGDVDLPGNNGLKDQLAALRWIHANIAVFGGDPSSVTLAGLSAGGASVHYHLLSPLSRGLFKNAISISGTALCQWTLADALPQKTEQIALLLGCPSSPTRDLLACLRGIPGEKVVGLTKHFQPWMYNPFTPFGPTVEVDSPGAFLTQHPLTAALEGAGAAVPWLVGVTSEEGLYQGGEYVNDDAILADLDTHWDAILPHLLDYNYTVRAHEQQNVARQIRAFFLGDKQVSRDSVTELVQMLGDRHFVLGMEKAARLHAHSSSAPVYFYRFAYRGKHSLTEQLANTTANFGVSHADDVGYVLETPFTDANSTASDLAMSRLLLKIWTSFAGTGTPLVGDSGLEWTAIRPDAEEMHYLHIGAPDDIAVRTSADLGHRDFWDTLPFYQQPALPAEATFEVTIV